MPRGSKLRPGLDTALRRIMDIMTGVDGGVGFVALRQFLEQLDKQAAEGDAAADQLLAVVTRFNALIDAAQRYAE